MHRVISRAFHIGLATAQGPVRERNEDACLATQFVLAESGEAPLPVGLFLVADGLGGQQQGEQASALACRLAGEHAIRHFYLPVLSGGLSTPINEILEESVEIAHRAIARQLPGAGSTLTMALVMGEDVHIAHVGDGRAYLGWPGRIQLATHDHSMAERLVELGQAKAEEVAGERRVLYKALGHGSEVKPDILHQKLEEGSYLLLCSDGLWGVLGDAEISAAVEASVTPDAACRRLVAQAIGQGADDNITVVMAARDWPLDAGKDRVG